MFVVEQCLYAGILFGLLVLVDTCVIFYLYCANNNIIREVNMNAIIAFIILLIFLSLASEVALFVLHVTIITIVFNHAHTQMSKKGITFGQLPAVLAI